MITKLWLALDIGTTGTKAALIDSAGHTLRSAYRDYPTHAAEGGIVEQNVTDWWQAAAEAVRELNASGVDALAITGQMQDVILLDGQADPLRPVILYSDTRAHAEADELNAQIGADRLCAITGNSQDAGSLLAKLLWLTYHEPQTLAKSAHLLFGAADYVAYRLTGEAISDTTTASTTGLLDINTRTLLSPALLAELSLSEVIRLLPEVKPGGARIGSLIPEAARMLNLEPGISVHHGPGDAGATTFGVGSGEPGSVYGYIGTSGWVAFTAEQRLTAETGVFTLAHPHPAKYIYVAPLLTVGGNLDWVRGLFDNQDHEELINTALDQEPTQLLYLPYLNGERSPFSDPFARGAFIGLSARHTRDDLSRALLEGVVYAYRHALDTLINESINRITLTGGGTRSQGWCQLFADITHVPVAIADDAANVGVRGAVLAGQVATGECPNYAPSGFFPTSEILQPGSTHSPLYDQKYMLFRAAYPALKAIFAQMHGS